MVGRAGASGLAGLVLPAGGTAAAQTPKYKDVPLSDTQILVAEPVFDGTLVRARNFDTSKSQSTTRYQTAEMAKSGNLPYTIIAFRQLDPAYYATARVQPTETILSCRMLSRVRSRFPPRRAAACWCCSTRWRAGAMATASAMSCTCWRNRTVS